MLVFVVWVCLCVARSGGDLRHSGTELRCLAQCISGVWYILVIALVVVVC